MIRSKVRVVLFQVCDVSGRVAFGAYADNPLFQPILIQARLELMATHAEQTQIAGRKLTAVKGRAVDVSFLVVCVALGFYAIKLQPFNRAASLAFAAHGRAQLGVNSGCPNYLAFAHLTRFCGVFRQFLRTGLLMSNFDRVRLVVWWGDFHD